MIITEILNYIESTNVEELVKRFTPHIRIADFNNYSIDDKETLEVFFETDKNGLRSDKLKLSFTSDGVKGFANVFNCKGEELSFELMKIIMDNLNPPVRRLLHELLLIFAGKDSRGNEQDSFILSYDRMHIATTSPLADQFHSNMCMLLCREANGTIRIRRMQ
jgi:hypothetical protein